MSNIQVVEGYLLWSLLDEILEREFIIKVIVTLLRAMSHVPQMFGKVPPLVSHLQGLGFVLAKSRNAFPLAAWDISRDLIRVRACECLT